MKMGLVALQESSGLDYERWIVWPVKDSAWELCIDYAFLNGSKGHLSYSNFRVGPVTEQYPLTISGLDDVNITIHLMPLKNLAGH